MTKRNIDRLLELIRSTFKLYDEKGQLINEYTENFNHKVILMTNILREKNIFGLSSKLKRLKFRAKETFYYGWGNEVFKNLREKYDIKSISLERFFQELNKYLDSIKKRVLEEYVLLLPINIDFKTNLPQNLLNLSKNIQISLENYNFFLKNYSRKVFDYIEKKYEKYADKNVLNLLHSIEYRKCFYIVIKLKARDKYYIAEIVNRNVAINLGIFCFIKFRLRRVMRYSRSDFISQHIAEINDPIMIVVKNDDVDNIFFSTFKNFTSYKSFGEEELNSYRIIIELIKNIKNLKIRFLIGEIFRLYYLALTDTTVSDSFMKFWNIIEILFLKKAGISEEKIKDRLKSVFKSAFKKDFDDMIELIYAKRNLLVHEAKNIITEADRDFIKDVSERSIDFFLHVTQEIQDKGMLEFLFDNMNKPENTLIKEIGILKFIKNLKF